MNAPGCGTGQRGSTPGVFKQKPYQGRRRAAVADDGPLQAGAARVACRAVCFTVPDAHGRYVTLKVHCVTRCFIAALARRVSCISYALITHSASGLMRAQAKIPGAPVRAPGPAIRCFLADQPRYPAFGASYLI
jgi:hypothetical protein